MRNWWMKQEKSKEEMKGRWIISWAVSSYSELRRTRSGMFGTKRPRIIIVRSTANPQGTASALPYLQTALILRHDCSKRGDLADRGSWFRDNWLVPFFRSTKRQVENQLLCTGSAMCCTVLYSTDNWESNCTISSWLHSISILMPIGA